MGGPLRGPRALAGAAVAAALVTGLAGGCGTNVPAGFAEAVTPRVSVAYPEKWSKVPAGRLTAHVAFAARRDAKRGAARVSVLTGLGSARDASLAVAMAMAGPQVGWRDYDKKGERALDVPGARDAARLDYTYTARQRTGAGTARGPAAGTDVVLVDDQLHVMIVRITWRAGAITEDTVSKVVGSVRVSGSRALDRERRAGWMARKAEEGGAPVLCVDRRQRGEAPPGRREPDSSYCRRL